MLIKAMSPMHTVGSRKGMVAAASFLMTVLMTACSAIPADPVSEEESARLLSGEMVFGEAVSARELPDVDLLTPSVEMQRFVESEVGAAGAPLVKFRRMFRGLTKEGYFNTSYIADSTRTAAETFQFKSGNCLSYTSMFISLARESGMNAGFQVVSVPPSWDADSGYLIRYTHVNVILKGFAYGNNRGTDFSVDRGSEFSVDFNDVLPDPDYPREEISDEDATSLYYANLSVQHLRADGMRASFVYLKKALELSPDNPDHWMNLGAFYAKQDIYEAAISSYQIALNLEPGHRGAISGLGRANHMLGNIEQAEHYNDQVRRYRARNPFYHFAIAQAEYENARYSEALASIETAIDLKHRNGRFHFLKGLTEYKLGDLEAAQASFKRASRYGNYRDLKQRYVNGLAKADTHS